MDAMQRFGARHQHVGLELRLRIGQFAYALDVVVRPGGQFAQRLAVRAQGVACILVGGAGALGDLLDLGLLRLGQIQVTEHAGGRPAPCVRVLMAHPFAARPHVAVARGPGRRDAGSAGGEQPAREQTGDDVFACLHDAFLSNAAIPYPDRGQSMDGGRARRRMAGVKPGKVA